MLKWGGAIGAQSRVEQGFLNYGQDPKVGPGYCERWVASYTFIITYNKYYFFLIWVAGRQLIPNLGHELNP